MNELVGVKFHRTPEIPCYFSAGVSIMADNTITLFGRDYADSLVRDFPNSFSILDDISDLPEEMRYSHAQFFLAGESPAEVKAAFEEANTGETFEGSSGEDLGDLTNENESEEAESIDLEEAEEGSEEEEIESEEEAPKRGRRKKVD